MQQRRDEIAAKKARLAELKRQRELRQQELGASRQDAGPLDEATLPSRAATQNPSQKDDLDDLITSLVGKGHLDGARRPQTPLNGSRSSPDASLTSVQASGGNFFSQPVRSNFGAGSKAAGWSISPLTIVQTVAKEPRQEAETYSKGVQTSTAAASTSADDSDGSTASLRERPARRRLSRRDGRAPNGKARSHDRGTTQVPAIPQQEDESLGHGARRSDLVNRPRVVADVELEAIAQSDDFRSFLEASSKVAERAIEDRYDLLRDYGLDAFDDEDAEIGGNGDGQKKGIRIREVTQLYDERWSKKRTISDLEWSPRFPELLLASYTKNPSAPHDPDGLVQIWNMHMQSRAEYVFRATTEIMTAKFSPFNPNLIVGASYAGQVLLWDTRSRSPWAVQKSPLTEKGHTHPVYSLNIVGSQNAHNIITTSTDGTVCTWSFNMLSEPHDRSQLVALPSTEPAMNVYVRSDEIAPTCTAFSAADASYFVAGTEEGTIHYCHRQNRAGIKAGIDPYVDYRGHVAPVMGVDFHRPDGPADLSELMLSCGLDWSIKLWQVKAPAVGISSATSTRTSTKPLLDLARDEVVYDVKWSPVRPAVFAAVDGAGRLEVWDLNSSMEAPASTATPSQKLAESAFRQPSLNKCAWEWQEGQNIAVGGLDGVVTVFEVGNELGGSKNARTEEWMWLKGTATRLTPTS